MIKTKQILYLASKSPRRRHLLKILFPEIQVLDVETEEVIIPNESPVKTVKRIAVEKMDAALLKVKNGVIITADTVVVLDGNIIGKPKNKKHAFEILRSLSNRTHIVYTGLCVHSASSGKRIVSFEKTNVVFRQLSDKEIRDYIATGSPMDKAGAYGIQDDFGAVFVKKIIGCYYNVVGLPLTKTHAMLKEVL